MVSINIFYIYIYFPSIPYKSFVNIFTINHATVSLANSTMRQRLCSTKYHFTHNRKKPKIQFFYKYKILYYILQIASSKCRTFSILITYTGVFWCSTKHNRVTVRKQPSMKKGDCCICSIPFLPLKFYNLHLYMAVMLKRNKQCR